MSKWHRTKLTRRRWAAARRAALDRDGWRCQQCGRAGRLEVDHIRPIFEGGPVYELANLQALCVACHVRKSRADAGLPAETPFRDGWRRLVAELAGP